MRDTLLLRVLSFFLAVASSACLSRTPTRPPTSTTGFTPLPAFTLPTSPPSFPTSAASVAPLPTPWIMSGLAIPPGWFAVSLDSVGLAGVLFVKQDPALLAAFDDLSRAVPADFAGGALVITPLPPGADPAALQAGMTASLYTMGDQDFGALLEGADRAGLIDLAAVAETKLRTARQESLGGRPAIALGGTLRFDEGWPPVLIVQAVLTWTDDSFVAFYALATEAAWLDVVAEFDVARQSLTLP